MRRTFAELAPLARERSDSLPKDGFIVCSGPPDAVLVDLLATDLVRGTAVFTDPGWPPDVRRRALDAARSLAEPRTDETRLVVFTSGSTGTPRPILRTLESWTSSFAAFSAYTGIGRDDTVLIPGPLSSSLFLFGAVHALAVGAALRFEAAHDCTVAHAVPAMLPTLAETAAGLRTVVCAGAHLRPTMNMPFDIVEYYGAAELSFVAIGRRGYGLRAFEGVELLLQNGILYARSPYVATSATRTADGWSTAGDRAELSADGVVTILGRDETVVNCGGATIQAEGVEAVLRSAPTVGDVAVVGRPHAVLGEVVAAVVEARPGRTPSLQALRRFAASALPAAERPRLWYAIDRLPRNGSGKVARSAVVEHIAQDELEPLG